VEGKVRIIVLMGVSGCGKSLIGASLAEKLGLEFIEGDDYHSAENKEKMAQGIRLHDEDRLSWLGKLRNLFQETRIPLVVSCSALKKTYRKFLASDETNQLFVHLHTSKEVIEQRLKARKGHFFNPGLLSSQFEILEPLVSGELGFQVNVVHPEHLVLAEIITRLDDYNL
jgi:carbohydrate kinase (thermoresistant glucokinase family)